MSATNSTLPPKAPSNQAPQKARTTVQNIGLILAFIVLGAILLVPTPETLSTGSHRMILTKSRGTSQSNGHSECFEIDYFGLFVPCHDPRWCGYVYLCSYA